MNHESRPMKKRTKTRGGRIDILMTPLNSVELLQGASALNNDDVARPNEDRFNVSTRHRSYFYMLIDSTN